MADKQIINLTERPWANMTGTDVTALESVAGTTFKAELADLKQYVLEGRYIGGAGVSDILTSNGTQTTTNKTLTSPTLNGTVTLGTTAITATGTEINQLAGIVVGGPDADDIATIGGTETLSGKTLASPTITGTITVGAIGISATELGYLDGATSNLQTQINAMISTTTNTYTYGYAFTAEGTGEIFNASTVITAIGLNPTNWVMDPTSLMMQIYDVPGAYNMNNLSAVSISYTTQQSGGQTYVNNIAFTGLTYENNYSLVISFKVLQKAA